ncbi:phycobilisome protein [Leptolyngbya sp. FACHB-261]|uniref:phycobilisome protein n=1 Tax=Leptolyngbya sp. FACHB-261 TaxID=2692806 RepID=UPI001685C699|nr:phycobilisome protein [Leptolyngbya sp. FACHB-261]MBD2100871.1 phycobilisome protein [Leptolyngbya sp. FACHB-261]
MFTLNHKLREVIADADGRYLSTGELLPLEQYAQTFEHRSQAYESLRDHAEPLIAEALGRLGQAYPELIKQHGSRCQYDMGEVVRYIALSILRDDEVFFKEEMLAWLDTILVSMKRNEHCAKAYRFLQEAIGQRLPERSTAVIRPYLDVLIQTLESHI